MSTHIQYIGSNPTWGPQQQIARRHAIEQTSVTLGDASQSDSNIRDRSRDPGANPYQMRWRDPTVSAVQANVQWRRKKFSTNELGLADADPTIKPNYQDPHQRRHLDAAYGVLPTNAALRLRLNTNDLGLTDADATVKPPWADGAAFYWPAPRQPAAITATNLFRLTRLTTNDLGIDDADPTIIAPWEYAHPFSLYKRDPTISAIETVEQLRRKRLSTNELGTADQDTSIRPVYQDPHQRRHGDPAWYVQPTLAWLRLRLNTNDLGDTNTDPTIRPVYQDPHQRRHGDPAIYPVQSIHAWLRLRLTTNDLGLDDQDVTIRPNWQAANPYQLYQRPSTVAGIEAWHLQLHLWEASTPTTPDADPTVTLPPPQPPTLRRVDYAPYVTRRPFADQSDQGTVAPTPTPDTSQPGGRNGPANPREWAMHQAQREQVRREDDEILFLI